MIPDSEGPAGPQIQTLDLYGTEDDIEVKRMEAKAG